MTSSINLLFLIFDSPVVFEMRQQKGAYFPNFHVFRFLPQSCVAHQRRLLGFE